MAHNLKAVFAAADHLNHDILCLRSHTQMDLLRPKPQYSPGPVVAPIGIGCHLALIHYGHIKIFVVIEHFYCTGLTDCAGDLQGLLAGNHGAGHVFTV